MSTLVALQPPERVPPIALALADGDGWERRHLTPLIAQILAPAVRLRQMLEFK